ncbi:MAG: PKD domain-containing protein, partial [Candidatus Omnitrophica bacterium]|nr:PKD domain-containing protein [Candidatus Omnitrophota bacterium]
MSPNCNQFTFDATGSADPDNERISFSWDFGDGNTAVGAIVDHEFEKSGQYAVSLKITDNSGSECAEDSITQDVIVNIPPYVEFVSPSRVCADSPILIDASKSQDDQAKPLSHYWNFGDGTHLTTRNQTVQKTYANGGTYEITLTVDDNMHTICNTATDSRMIYVNEAPVVGAGPTDIFKCIQREDDLRVQFDASNTTDVNADVLKYVWEMGDGRTREGVKVDHAYPGAGLYDVKLLVDDNSGLDCSSAVAFYKVRLSKAPQAEAGADVVGCVGEEIS